jgi:hypothetical protein
MGKKVFLMVNNHTITASQRYSQNKLGFLLVFNNKNHQAGS